MEILVTGANGFLGKHIVKELVNDNNVKCLTRTYGDYKVSLESGIPEFVHKFDLVIHAAGKAHSVPKTEIEIKEFYDVNVLGTQNLLKGLEKVGHPKQFIFISSVAVYGCQFGQNIHEMQELHAQDPYGLSKITAEDIIISYCKNSSIICTILRLPLLVGQNPPGNLGAMLKAIDDGYYFNIGGGKAKKSMVLAQDVASFIPKVAPVGGIFNLTDGFHPSFLELSNVLATNKGKKTPLNIPITIAKFLGYIGDFLGNKTPINSLKLKKITSDLTFNDTKARKELSWNPQKVLEYLQTTAI